MSEPDVPEFYPDPMTEPGDAVQQITRALESLAGDDTYREGVTRFVPGAGAVYGVRVLQLRHLAARIHKSYRSHSDAVVELAELCWQVGSREHRVLAILILAGLKTLTPTQRWAAGLLFLPLVSDWETCDQLCMGLLGQALAEDAQFMDILETWTRADNFWVRRAALASTVVLRRANYDPAIMRLLNQRTLGICLALLDDEEHYVRKAVDWAVREVIGRDYESGKRWLMERAGAELSRVAYSTLKKSAKKLTPEDQEQFLQKLE